MIKTSSIIRESLQSGLRIESSKSQKSQNLIVGKRPKMRVGPVETSDFIFGPDIQDRILRSNFNSQADGLRNLALIIKSGLF